MHRIIPLLLCMVFFGCSNPLAKAPTLRITVEGENGNSQGLHRVLGPGPLSASGTHDSRGNGVSQQMIIDEITDQAILLTVQRTDSSSDRWSKQVRIPYNEKTVVRLPNNATLTATLERPE